MAGSFDDPVVESPNVSVTVTLNPRFRPSVVKVSGLVSGGLAGMPAVSGVTAVIWPENPSGSETGLFHQPAALACVALEEVA